MVATAGRPRPCSKPVHQRAGKRYHPPDMHPAPQVPSIPAASFHLPPRLEGLRHLASSLYWCWHPRARTIWSRIDRGAWTGHRNPIPVLERPRGMNTPPRATRRSWRRSRASSGTSITTSPTAQDNWFQRQYPDMPEGPIAYFCAEYGFYESLGIYSGRLGVLAGDRTQDDVRHGPPVHRRRASCIATATSTRRSTPTATRSLRLSRLRPLAAAAQQIRVRMASRSG